MKSILLILSVAAYFWSANSAALPSQFNKACFGCVLQNFKYCGDSDICVALTDRCNSTFYTNTTGCPVRSKCDLGIEGFVYLDDPSNSSATLHTNVNDKVAINVPSNYPCALGIANINNKALTWQVSGAYIGAQYLQIDFPNQVAIQQTQFLNPISEFEMSPNNDMVFLYLGSINQNPQTLFLSWLNKAQSTANVDPNPFSSLLSGQIIQVTVLAISLIGASICI